MENCRAYYMLYKLLEFLHATEFAACRNGGKMMVPSAVVN